MPDRPRRRGHPAMTIKLFSKRNDMGVFDWMNGAGKVSATLSDAALSDTGFVRF